MGQILIPRDQLQTIRKDRTIRRFLRDRVLASPKTLLRNVNSEASAAASAEGLAAANNKVEARQVADSPLKAVDSNSQVNSNPVQISLSKAEGRQVASRNNSKEAASLSKAHRQTSLSKAKAKVSMSSRSVNFLDKVLEVNNREVSQVNNKALVLVLVLVPV